MITSILRTTGKTGAMHTVNFMAFLSASFIILFYFIFLNNNNNNDNNNN